MLQYSQVATLPKADTRSVENLMLWLRGNQRITGPGAGIWGKVDESPPAPKRYQFLHALKSVLWAPSPKENDLDLIVPCLGYKADSLTRRVADECVEFYNIYQVIKSKMKGSSRQDSEQGQQFSINSKPNVIYRTWEDLEAGKPSGDRENALLASRLYRYFGTPIVRIRTTITTLIACLLPTAAIAGLSTIHNTGLLIGVIGIFTLSFAVGLMFFTSTKPSRVEVFSATAV